MHNAPSVSYPVGRLRFPVWIPAGLWLAAGLSLMLWASIVETDAAMAALAVSVWLACGAAALWGWRRTERGTLHWDGTAWRWQADASAEAARTGQTARPHAGQSGPGDPLVSATADEGVTGRAACALDLQSHLWVRWTDDAPPGRGRPAVRWFWLRRADDAAQWLALRRALFARSS